MSVNRELNMNLTFAAAVSVAMMGAAVFALYLPRVHHAGAVPVCATTADRADVCVVDGDTVWIRGEKIRIENIDAPEILTPGCDSERALAQAARDRLAGIMSGATLRLRGQGRDRYGRTLAKLSVNGRDAGAQLIAEGLAVQWAGRRHEWCEASQ